MSIYENNQVLYLTLIHTILSNKQKERNSLFIEVKHTNKYDVNLLNKGELKEDIFN